MNRPKPPVKSAQSKLPCVFRIIGGEWRSRKFHFPDTFGLRPTPDRVRETLFNWLSEQTPDAECLDLFCGSGALGLEALSRGAKNCTFVDAEMQTLIAINQHLNTLDCKTGKILCTKLPEGLNLLHHPFDIVFIDPPYALDCIETCLMELSERNLLKDNAWIYVECSSQRRLPALPDNFHLHRNKTTGQVMYSLYRHQYSTSTLTSLSKEVPL